MADVEVMGGRPHDAARLLLERLAHDPEHDEPPADPIGWATAIVVLEIAERLDAITAVLHELEPLIEKYTNNPAARFMRGARGRG